MKLFHTNNKSLITRATDIILPPQNRHMVEDIKKGIEHLSDREEVDENNDKEITNLSHLEDHPYGEKQDDRLGRDKAWEERFYESRNQEDEANPQKYASQNHNPVFPDNQDDGPEFLDIKNLTQQNIRKPDYESFMTGGSVFGITDDDSNKGLGDTATFYDDPAIQEDYRRRRSHEEGNNYPSPRAKRVKDSVFGRAGKSLLKSLLVIVLPLAVIYLFLTHGGLNFLDNMLNHLDEKIEEADKSYQGKSKDQLEGIVVDFDNHPKDGKEITDDKVEGETEQSDSEEFRENQQDTSYDIPNTASFAPILNDNLSEVGDVTLTIESFLNAIPASSKTRLQSFGEIKPFFNDSTVDKDGERKQGVIVQTATFTTEKHYVFTDGIKGDINGKAESVIDTISLFSDKVEDETEEEGSETRETVENLKTVSYTPMKDLLPKSARKKCFVSVSSKQILLEVEDQIKRLQSENDIWRYRITKDAMFGVTKGYLLEYENLTNGVTLVEYLYEDYDSLKSKAN